MTDYNWQNLKFEEWRDEKQEINKLFLFTDAEDANKVLQIKQYVFKMLWNCGD